MFNWSEKKLDVCKIIINKKIVSNIKEKNSKEVDGLYFDGEFKNKSHFPWPLKFIT